jgi:hypothetical protein
MIGVLIKWGPDARLLALRKGSVSFMLPFCLPDDQDDQLMISLINFIIDIIQRPRSTMLSLLVAALLAYPLVHFFGTADERPTCRYTPVPPRANADGTLDHVIIRKCEGDKGRYTIIRLPAIQAIRLSQNMEPTEVRGFDGPPVTLSSSTNRYIVGNYDLSKDWKPISESEMKDMDNKFIGEITFTRFEPDFTRSSLIEQLENAKLACEPATRHNNGIVEYRLRKDRDPKTYPPCFGALTKNANSRTFVSENPAAVFDCSLLEEANGVIGSCRGNLDLADKLHVGIRVPFITEPTAQQMSEIIPHVVRQAEKAFVGSGDLDTHETFSFEKLRE